MLTFLLLNTERFQGKLDPRDLVNEDVIIPKGLMAESFIAYYNGDNTSCICIVPSNSVTKLTKKKLITKDNILPVEVAEATTKAWSSKFKINETAISEL